MDYQKHYNNLISTRLLLKNERIKLKQKGIYFEGHHIIPKSLGGTGRSYNYSHINIILLTAREHFIAHWLLFKINPCKQNINAFWRMCIGRSNTHKKYYSSKAYEEARLMFVDSMKGNKYATGNNTPKSNTNNMKWSKEKREKIVLATTGKSRVGNFKGNKYFLGKKRPEIAKIRLKQVLEVKTNNIFFSKEKCMKDLQIKNNWQFYKKIKQKELIYV
jgi:hypothetical protein